MARAKYYDKVSGKWIYADTGGISAEYADATYVKASKLGAANGVATLDENGKIPSDQISDINLDEVLEDIVIFDKEDDENVEIPEGEVVNITIDSELSTTSTNPVQNKVITQELNEISTQVDNTVKVSAQELTDEQKIQARENIGAVSVEDVEAIISGNTGPQFNETGDLVELNVEEGTPLSVISRFKRDETWEPSNKLVLHQVSGSNFVDLASIFGGVGNVITKNGVTATINADGTISIKGTNESDGAIFIIDLSFPNEDYAQRIYPAGTYTFPGAFILQIKGAAYPSWTTIEGASGNIWNKFTAKEPFRIVQLSYYVGAGSSVDVMVPFGFFYNMALPESGIPYLGEVRTVTFDTLIYEGEFNWSTGELKDVDGNTIGYYGSHDITSLPGTNYFWTGFGENTVSNAPEVLDKVVLYLDDIAPEETVPSICDFTLTPTTMQAAYNLTYIDFMSSSNIFTGREVPLLTTTGDLVVKDINGVTKYSKHIENLIGYRNIFDTLTERGIHKVWSDKFYLNASPVSTVRDDNYDTTVNVTWTWEFTEDDFINTGIPAKLDDIPIATPCFYNESNSEEYMKYRVYFAQPYPAKFSYDTETGKYILIVKGCYDSIQHQLTTYSKVYFHYPLETPYDIQDGFAMGISAGDSVSFVEDYSEAQEFIDRSIYKIGNGKAITEYNIKPILSILTPRNVVDAMGGMKNAAYLLNIDNSMSGGDATVQGYSWIGDGDGVTDYTAKIQNKLNELHTVSNGGTIHLGSGTYPISKSLIVYSNTRIIGNGKTSISQISDNTHAIVWSGSNIVMRDLTVRLSGICTELTACIYANSNNREEGYRDERYPENIYVHNCSVSNVTLIGSYGLTWHDDGYQSLSEDALAYRGVGIYSKYMFFNYFDCDRAICKGLYSGVHGGGGANTYRLFVTDSRIAVYDNWSGNNQFIIEGHSLYGTNRDGTFGATDHIIYCDGGQNNIYYALGFYDTQWINVVAYFTPKSQGNICYVTSPSTGLMTPGFKPDATGRDRHATYINFGRCNEIVEPLKKTYFTVGNRQFDLTGQTNPNMNSSATVDNALAGAGVWGSITSNIEWLENGISLAEVCRYPKDSSNPLLALGSVVSTTQPSDDAPIEIIIDISNRPICSYCGLWIQFDHRYAAQDIELSYDITGDGTYNWTNHIHNEAEPTIYSMYSQTETVTIYRIKIKITKAVVIPNLEYVDAAYGDHTIDYNLDGLIGIVNIGMLQNDAYGRAFLGECGGSLYGNVDMHQNTLKNLPAPVEDGDAVSKAYLEQRLAELEALITAMP